VIDDDPPAPASKISKVEVFRLRVGCPPEHLYQLLHVAVDRASIEKAVDECAGLRAIPAIGVTMSEGGGVLEFRFHLSDGSRSVVRRLEDH
jgi:hypothetical protein